jgi:hypothetical protein
MTWRSPTTDEMLAVADRCGHRSFLRLLRPKPGTTGSTVPDTPKPKRSFCKGFCAALPVGSSSSATGPGTARQRPATTSARIATPGGPAEPTAAAPSGVSGPTNSTPSFSTRYASCSPVPSSSLSEKQPGRTDPSSRRPAPHRPVGPTRPPAPECTYRAETGRRPLPSRSDRQHRNEPPSTRDRQPLSSLRRGTPFPHHSPVRAGHRNPNVTEVDHLIGQVEGPEPVGQRGDQGQPRTGHRPVIVEGHCKTSRTMRFCAHRKDAFLFWLDVDFSESHLPSTGGIFREWSPIRSSDHTGQFGGLRLSLRRIARKNLVMTFQPSRCVPIRRAPAESVDTTTPYLASSQALPGAHPHF